MRHFQAHAISRKGKVFVANKLNVFHKRFLMRILATLLVPLLLCASEEHNAQSIFSSLEASVEHLVHGAVNPITGDYTIGETDIVVPGIEPIVINRSYVSSDESHYQAGWSIGPQTKISTITRRDYIRKHKFYDLKIYEPSGAYLIYGHCNPEETLYKPKVSVFGELLQGKGERQSARGNLANNRLVVKHKYLYVLYHADGSEKHYRAEKRKDSRTKLVKEIKPNGNVIRYLYNQERLYRIESLNPHETMRYAWAEFRYHTDHNDDPAFDLITSDGRRMTFNTTRYGDKHDHYFFTDFHLHGAPHETLNFFRHEKRHYVKSRSFGYGRRATITYENNQVVAYNTNSGDDMLVRQATFRYFPKDLKTQVHYKNKRVATYHYDKQNKLLKIAIKGTPSADLTVHYNYEGTILKSKRYETPSAEPLTKAFTFDQYGNLEKEIITGDLKGNGKINTHTTHTLYNNKHYPIKQTIPGGITHLYTYSKDFNHIESHTIEYKGEVKEKTLYFYDGNYNLIKEVHKAGPFKHITRTTRRKQAPAIGYPETVTTTYQEHGEEKLLSKTHTHYNSQNLPIRVDHYDATDTLAYSIYSTYDKLGRQLTQTDPLGRISSKTYDQFNNVLTEQSGSKVHPISHTYDLANNRTSTTEAHLQSKTSYTPLSEVATETSSQGLTTTYEYDTESNPMSITDTGTTHITYGPYRNPLTTTDPLGHTTTISYTSLTKPKRITDPLGHVTTHTYNLDQTLATTTAPDLTITSYTYDYKKRPTSVTITDPMGKIIKQETTTYNCFGPTTYTDPLGNVTTTTYDGAGRPIAQATATSKATTTYDTLSRPYITNADGRITITTYDLANRPLTVRETDITDHTYSFTSHTYDIYDNILSTTTDDVTHTYTYDDFGRQTSHIDGLNNTSTSTYTDCPYTVTETNPNNISTTSTYTPKGLLASISTLDQITIHSYDLVDNRIETTHTHPGQTYIHAYAFDANKNLLSHSHNSKTTIYAYDNLNRQTSVTQPDGTTIFTIYNHLSQPVHVYSSDLTVDYHNTYDVLGNLLTSISPEHTLTRTYNSASQLLTDTLDHLTISHSYTNSQRTTLSLPDTTIGYTYDPYHLTSITHKNLTHSYIYDRHNIIQETTPITTTTYSYNSNNQGISSTSSLHSHQILSLDPNSNILETTTSSYTYTALDQIASESGPFTNTYTLDSHHQRLFQNNEQFTYSTDHQLLATPTSTHTYDVNGLRIQTDDTHYTYDALGRLLTDGTNTYTYDYLNRRVTQNSIYYLYDHNLEVGRENLEYRVLGVGQGADIGATTLIYLNNTPYVPLHDLFGNITALYRLDSTLLESYVHNPFGVELTNNHPQNPYRYQSKRHDGKLIHFGRRFYDPSSATWLTPDPAGYLDSPNLYQFLHNNPLTNLDRFGLVTLKRYNLHNPENRAQFASKIDDWSYIARYAIVRSAIDWTNLKPLPAIQLIHRGIHAYRRIKHNRPRTILPRTKIARVRAGSNDFATIYENGICTSWKKCQSTAADLSQYIPGTSTYALYNPSYGFVIDCSAALINRAGIQTPSTKANGTILAEKLVNYKEILAVGHSAGAPNLDVSFHGKTINPQDRMERVHFLTVGPAKYLDRAAYAGGKNMMDTQDILNLLHFRDNISAIKGNGDKIEFIGTGTNPISAHFITNPNYQNCLKEELGGYQKKWFGK